MFCVIVVIIHIFPSAFMVFLLNSRPPHAPSYASTTSLGAPSHSHSYLDLCQIEKTFAYLQNR